MVLTCQATGFKPLNLTWTKVGDPTFPSKQASGVSSLDLTIDNATTKDIGDYECKATNSLGTASKTTSTNRKYTTKRSTHFVRFKIAKKQRLITCLNH